jgi:3-oxoacyl-[acyl-carrier protein] reductase|tara:strand:+ start:158 stop:934 length:777 start_codon:yes stop_codon:yes gene_type:complete
MDLGIRGKNAIVCASSRGLGRACAIALAREGVNVTINGRNEEALKEVVGSCSKFGVNVQSVMGDITKESTRDSLLGACPAPDILITNNAGPPPGKIADWDYQAWIGALEANMITHMLMIRAVLEGMVERKFGRIVNITSAMVKTPKAPMGLSTGARAGLTSVSKALSVEVAHANVTINNMLPERINTDRQKFMAEMQSELQGISVEEAYAQIAGTIAAGRLGLPEEFGDACAFLCSAQAGFISGQNLQLDGGSYEGLI